MLKATKSYTVIISEVSVTNTSTTLQTFSFRVDIKLTM